MIEKNQAQNLTLIVIREIQVNLTQTLFPQEPNLCITLEDILTFILNRSKNQRLPGGKLPDATQNNWRNKEQSWRQKDIAEWSNLTVVFANDKVSGEGEHKLLDYIRKYGNSYYTYCIYGSDADFNNVVNVCIDNNGYKKYLRTSR